MRESRDNLIRRTSRILEIIQLISNRPNYWTRKSLADRFEISERSIQKDLEVIRISMSLPLENKRNGYFFASIPNLPPACFTFREAVSLLLAARGAKAIPGVDSTDLVSAISRLESVFPISMRDIMHETLLQFPSTAKKEHRQEMLYLLNLAYYKRQKITILYHSQNQETAKERLVAPYAIIPYGRSWFLIAHDNLRDGIRQFKVDRIARAELSEETFSIPTSFDLDSYMGDAWGMMRGAAGQAENVHLLFDAEAGRWVSEENWHKSQSIRQLADGTFDVHFYVGVTPEMENWLLYYGAHVQIIEPDWLRKKIIRLHRDAADKGVTDVV